MENANMVIKKYLPSVALFIIGYFVCYKVEFLANGNTGLSFAGGYLFAGTVWGWQFTSEWFKPREGVVYVEKNQSSFFWCLKLLFRLFLSMLIGGYAMPVGIIKLIIALVVKGKEVSDAVNANKVEHTDQD